MIELGKRVKDSITGFNGIAIARTEWLYGCVRIAIQPTKLSKEGKTIEQEWFDEEQIVKVAGRSVRRKTNEYETKGGPQDDPKR